MNDEQKYAVLAASLLVENLIFCHTISTKNATFLEYEF